MITYNKYIEVILSLCICLYGRTLDSTLSLNKHIDVHFVVDKK